MSENYASLRLSDLLRTGDHRRRRLCLREVLSESSKDSLRQVQSNR